MQKQFRIKKSEDIANIVKNKDKVYCPYYTIYYQVSGQNKSKVAFSASKKYGMAFERNRAKRLMRELIRPYISKGDIYINCVIVVKPAFKDASFQQLTESMDYCYNLMVKKIK